MGKYVMERLFKVFNIAGMAFIFVGGHTGYISGKDMLYQLRDKDTEEDTEGE